MRALWGIGAAKDVVGADLVVVRQLDQGPDREIPLPLFVPPVHLPLAVEHFGNIGLCLVRIHS